MSIDIEFKKIYLLNYINLLFKYLNIMFKRMVI